MDAQPVACEEPSRDNYYIIIIKNKKFFHSHSAVLGQRTEIHYIVVDYGWIMAPTLSRLRWWKVFVPMAGRWNL